MVKVHVLGFTLNIKIGILDWHPEQTCVSAAEKDDLPFKRPLPQRKALRPHILAGRWSILPLADVESAPPRPCQSRQLKSAQQLLRKPDASYLLKRLTSRKWGVLRKELKGQVFIILTLGWKDSLSWLNREFTCFWLSVACIHASTLKPAKYCFEQRSASAARPLAIGQTHRGFRVCDAIDSRQVMETNR
jgi:hypothetical protein